ncbi:related to isotrichodermin C-15 hydroxylase (cytochrome P-450 monooxygenase CYP65A1) [Phialocephala subalpina]|uniref:Related to isotrichodermin C-15 hydroxylase (Cytochrome P-450 monooxygenase CYP65A1) n=1 Tax=Phialocephala subalpina TaxID=576137 RepID=A0A1L7WVY0_9HELO|nr:related to isotrichodermin C-15 hydroxylase (cytochrome P-450 monooxygenase CYP65A1) [Phialocephala subalpina]
MPALLHCQTTKVLQILGGLLAIFLLCLVCQIIYNVYFHPLSRFPGPKSWTSNRFTYIRHIWTGTLAREIREIHLKYGDVVRVAPDELSFATPDALQDIYTNFGQPAFPKGPVWNGTIPGQPTMVLNALNPSDHARMRKVVAPAFTEKAIRAQEGIIESYAANFVRCLEQEVSRAGINGTVLDITRWFNFTAFDLIGELVFGESFNCLDNNEFHHWAIQILATFKAVTCAVSLRYYPYLDWLLRLAIPKSVWETQKYHFGLAVDKVQRRLGVEKERQDVLGMLKMDEQARDGLTIRELHATAPLLIIAGSQTIVTVLSGITSYLAKNPQKLAFLTREVRESFRNENEITVSAGKDLGYLNAVLNEGLRLCMPAAGGLNRLTPPGGGTVAGYSLPGNIHVNVQPLSIHLSPRYFHDPTSFIPERWLPEVATDPTSAYYNDRRSSVLPFSTGPRSCIGKALAWAEMRLLLAKLVWSFDIEEVDSVKGRLRWDKQGVFIAVARQPFEVRLKARKV